MKGDDEIHGLDAAWDRLVGRACAGSLVAGLEAAWREPHRRYHTREHLKEMLSLFNECRELTERPDEVEVAIWFHDAVYEPRRKDNEECSAAWASDALLSGGADSEVVGRVVGLVMATKHDREAESADEELIQDIDLAVLGRDRDGFEKYDREIREEYGWVGEEEYRKGRAAALESFLRKEPLYRTAWFRERYEARARENLKRAIADLG